MGDKNDKEHLVVWLDLLGFRQRLEEPGSTATIGNLLEAEIPAAIHAANKILTNSSDGELHWEPMVEVEQFQDTIVLWTEGTERTELELLLVTASSLVKRCHRRGLPIRGAISVGTFYTSRLAKNPGRNKHDGSPITVVIGSAIGRAACLEKKVKFAGVVVDPRLTSLEADEEGHYAYAEIADYIDGSDLLVEYEGQTFLAWPGEFVDESDEDILRLIWPIPPMDEAAQKVEKTRTFLRHYREGDAKRREWLRGLRDFLATGA